MAMTRSEYLKSRASGATKPETRVVVQTAVESEPKPKAKKGKKSKKKSADRLDRFGRGLFGYNTACSVPKTRMQIEELLKKHGCDAFSYAADDRTGIATVQFRCRDRLIRFKIEMPRAEDFPTTTNGRKLAGRFVEARFERSHRQRWRALYLTIRSKIVSVESSISCFEEAFLPETVDPASGKTVMDLIRERSVLPQLAPAPVERPSVVEAEIEEDAA